VTEAERFKRDGEMALNIIKCVAREYWIAERELYGESRVAQIAKARHAIYWLVMNLTGFGQSDTGRLLKRYHSTVASGARCYERRTTAHERAVMALKCVHYPETYEAQGPCRRTAEAAE
jgi:chromosomal replication initiation ATPase DnaA